MKPASCTTPIDAPTLLAHWLGELDESEDARIAEHLLGCGHCTTEAQWLADLASGMRTLVAQGAIQAVVTAPFIRRAVADGLRLREYRILPDSSVNCTLGPEDDLLVARLVAPLAGMQRIDLLTIDAKGKVIQRLDDVPFDPASGEVLVASRTAEVRAMPATSFSMRLVAATPQGDRLLGSYGFHHSPWKGGK